MNRVLKAALFKAKCILSIVLVLSLHVVVGCGTTVATPSANANRILLTDDHPITQALAGTPFQGATAVELHPFTGQFRFIFPDGSREVSGILQTADGKNQLRQLSLGHSGQTMTILFNDAYQITTMAGSSGALWVRPADTLRTGRIVADDANPYLSANADLVELAQQFDAQNGTTVGGSTGTSGTTTSGSTDVKVGATAFPLAFFLFTFAFLPAAASASILFILQLALIVTLFI